MAALRVQTPTDEPVGALVSRVGTDVARLIRAEIALVQVRVLAVLSALRDAGAGLVASALLGVTGMGALVAGLVLLVARWLPAWVAAFAVGGGLVVLGLLLAVAQTHGLRRGVREALGPVEEFHGE